MGNEPPDPEKRPSEPVVRISFPSWLTVEWGSPFLGAFLTVLIGVGLQFLVGLLLVAGAAIAGGPIPWSSLAQIPPNVWLAFNLGVTSVVIILTGFMWIRLSVRLAARAISSDVAPTRNKVLEGAAKFAIVYAFLELAIAIVLRQTNPPISNLQFGFLSPSFGTGDPTGALLFGLLIGFVAGVYFFSRVTDVRVRDIWALRIEAQIPEVARTTWLGLVTALKIAVSGMMIFIYLTSFLPFFSHGEPKEAAIAAPALLALMVFWTGIDTGLGGMLLAMQLFLGQRTSFSFGPAFFGKPSWIYAGIAIPLIALFVGGIRVARESRSSTPAQAAVRGALVGIPLSLVCLIFASLHSIGESGGFIGRAFLVSFLWGGASAFGAFFEAAQHVPEPPAAPAIP